MDITPLQTHLPAVVYAQLPPTISAFVINDVLKLAHFLGQCDYESEQWTAVTENLNYSAQALLKTFAKYFDAGSAATYARQPEKIGDRVYANRMGNGDEASGDGFRYRNMRWSRRPTISRAAICLRCASGEPIRRRLRR
ncbi:MAG TPA: hypothetical protein VNW04_21075 [Puia sp.]|jgi:putative chitinase|nr:hypothetical protein [Puia sp.]